MRSNFLFAGYSHAEFVFIKQRKNDFSSLRWAQDENLEKFWESRWEWEFSLVDLFIYCDNIWHQPLLRSALKCAT
jgi:hypothetical protein